MNRKTLLPGVHVAIVAPGGYAPDEAAYLRALDRLREYGCTLHNFYQPEAKFQRFGGEDAARAAQLHAAAAHPEVQIVLALRGGYGMSRLLPLLDLPALAGSGKLFVGHSDVTALQMALLGHGAISFAGPMVCDDFSREDLSEFTLDDFERCLTEPAHDIAFGSEGSPALDVAGTLWGGNLAMLCHLAGTPWLPALRDGILFVEDVNEHPFRVERMLLQLHYAGVLDRQQAIVLGDFSNFRLFDYDNGYDFAAMLAYLRSVVRTPILTGLPFGHSKDKATLAVGAAARLHCDGARATLSMTGYPTVSVQR